MRSIKIVAIVIALSIIFSGCNLIEVNEERDAQVVVAQVGDEVVTKGDVSEIYDMYLYYYGITDESEIDASYLEYFEDMKDGILDDLVNEKLDVVKAKEDGYYEFTDEEQAEIDEEVDGTVDIYRSMYRTEIEGVEANAELSEEEIDALVEAGLDEYLALVGIDVVALTTQVTEGKAKDKLYATITEGIEVTEEEIQTAYDGNVVTQQLAYDEGTSSYEQDVNDGVAIYTIPEGVRRAQHILIKISDEKSEEIAALTAAEDEAGAAALLEEALAEIKPAVDAAYERAIAGEDFVALIEELGEDPGMESHEAYDVMNPTSVYMPEFSDALFALENVGDISEPVSTDFGYHVIKFYEELESGPVPYDNFYEDLKIELTETAKDTYYSEQKEIWKESIKTKVNYKKLHE